MSKRNISASDSSDNKRKKRSELTGFCAVTIYHILKHLNRVPHKGDWRRHRMISIKFVVGEIRWFNKHLVKDSCFKIVTPVPVGVQYLLAKLESASGRNFDTLPQAVVEFFKLQKNKYKQEDFSVEVSYTGNNYFLLLFIYFIRKILERFSLD